MSLKFGLGAQIWFGIQNAFGGEKSVWVKNHDWASKFGHLELGLEPKCQLSYFLKNQNYFSSLNNISYDKFRAISLLQTRGTFFYCSLRAITGKNKAFRIVWNLHHKNAFYIILRLVISTVGKPNCAAASCSLINNGGCLEHPSCHVHRIVLFSCNSRTVGVNGNTRSYYESMVYYYSSSLKWKTVVRVFVL